MTEQDVLIKAEQKMHKSLDIAHKELATIRTGHATPGLIEHLKVEYAGALLPLNQLGNIAAPGASMLTVQPWDRSSIGSIEKAILKSDLGFNPTNDGQLIRINIPPLTEERRQELIKIVRKRIEEGKIAIRNLRRESLDELKTLEKNKEISQDDQKRLLNQLQKITDNFIADMEQMGKNTASEIKEI